MDKKMYIDGVDVSECKHFYSDEMCDNEQTLSCVCVKNKECEYKQLKRLQTENETFKTYSAIYERDKYSQCLKEIKEIILEMCGEQCGACFIEMCNQKCRYAKIQNKINEVIGAE